MYKFGKSYKRLPTFLLFLRLYPLCFIQVNIIQTIHQTLILKIIQYKFDSMRFDRPLRRLYYECVYVNYIFVLHTLHTHTRTPHFNWGKWFRFFLVSLQRRTFARWKWDRFQIYNNHIQFKLWFKISAELIWRRSCCNRHFGLRLSDFSWLNVIRVHNNNNIYL